MRPFCPLPQQLVIAAAVILVGLAGAGCVRNLGSIATSGGDGEVCYWISADADTYIGPGPEADRNFGREGSVSVSGFTSVQPSRLTFVRFPYLHFPQGTEILEAKFQLFMGGKNEDGQGDDITMAVDLIHDFPWSPLTLTWNTNDAGRRSWGGTYPFIIRPQNWCTTENIAEAVRTSYANQDKIHGYVVSYRRQTAHRKGFSSNQDFSRKQNDLGKAPRLLLRVKLPAGSTTSDVTLPFLAADTDLTLPRPVTTVRFSVSSTWPADWDVE